jgi:hypothetical protein
MTLNVSIHPVQQGNVAIQLIPNLDTQLVLPSDRLAKPIQLVILVAHGLLVVVIDLLVIHTGLVRTWR